MPSKVPVYTGRYATPYHIFTYYCGGFACSLNSPAVLAAESPLTLSDAMSRAMAQNPLLKVFDLRLDGLQGRRVTADLNPALEAGAEIENFLGTGDVRGLAGAELTLTLSSTLELGGQRQARVSAIDSRLGLIEAERRAETLDLLGQVTQRLLPRWHCRRNFNLPMTQFRWLSRHLISSLDAQIRAPHLRLKSCEPGLR